MQTKADYLFESSWEVCNKVGGIYTVVKSKAKLLTKLYKNYFLIGPYFEHSAKIDFTPKRAPKILQPVFDDLKNQGIICHFGEWNIKGEPNVILIESSALKNQKDYYKGEFWNKFQVDSMGSGWDFEEPMLWSIAVGMLLERLPQALNSDKIVGHFHEWLAGFTLLYLKLKNSPVKTVFTTHATMLGRSISGSGQNLYGILNKINPEQEARNQGVMNKFSTERACANNADVFTTVSEITSMEAEKLLGRKADVLLLNGLDSSQFPTFEQISIKHQKSKEAIHEFLSYYFFPYYSFDLDNSLNLFISGRFEFKNKGLDILIKSLANINNQLKKNKSKRMINVFFWIPRDVNSTNLSLSDSKANYIQLREYIEDHSSEIIDNIKDNFLTSPLKDLSKSNKIKCTLFDKEFISQIKNMRLKFSKDGNPLLCTHALPNEHLDPILNMFKENGLNNKQHDVVKVIYYPIYLTGVDGLLDLKYYDAILGCHLGIFPSSYEPWGYTPLESAALGIPAITTNLAGFGRFINSHNKKGGVYVLERYNKSDDEATKELAKLILKYYKYSPKERVQQKVEAKHLASLADWNTFIENYVEAHNLALSKNQEN
ncbi:MAG: glycosyltransferase [Nanoarchaeota archaeon]|nr:glycosyltransferase [Nanoarchaeota archaeon]